MKFFKKPLAVLLTLAMVIGIFAAVGVNTSAAEPELWVGGVAMADGDYLANGATATTTTKPSGGYAYFKDGVLTLNNYEYEGAGVTQSNGSFTWAVLISHTIPLTLNLKGDNKLIFVPDSEAITSCYAVGSYSDIRNDRDLTVEGDGKLSTNAERVLYSAMSDITVNGGIIEGNIRALNESLIMNDGYVTGDAFSGCRKVIINGGTVYGARITSDFAITINGGNILAVNRKDYDDDTATYAIWVLTKEPADSITFASSLVIKASTEPYGELVDYVAENHKDYDMIVIGDIHICDVALVEGTEADCENDGYKPYYECECGKCYLDENCEEEIADINEWKSGDGLIPALNHPERTDTVVTEATCSKEGVIETTCDICGEVIATTAIEKLPHAETIDVPTTKPTCTDAGIIETFCTECGEKTATKPVESTGHDEGIWKVDFEATAEHDGQMTRYCTKCNAVLETKTFEKHTHTEGYTKTIPATCTQDGEKATFCAECGTCYKTEVIEKTGHGETVETVSVKPTCTQAGENVKYCKDCGVAVETVVVEATDHAWSTYSTNANGSHSKTCCNCGVEEKENCTYTATTTASTCLESGYTKHECDVCGHSYIDSETPALGHKWGKWTDDANGTSHTRECDACGEKETHDHEWGEWTYNEDGTFTENGTKTRVCAICGAEETDTANHTSDICRFFYPIICFFGNIVHKILYGVTLDWLFPEITIKPEF